MRMFYIQYSYSCNFYNANFALKYYCSLDHFDNTAIIGRE